MGGRTQAAGERARSTHARAADHPLRALARGEHSVGCGRAAVAAVARGRGSAPLLRSDVGTRRRRRCDGASRSEGRGEPEESDAVDGSTRAKWRCRCAGNSAVGRSRRNRARPRAGVSRASTRLVSPTAGAAARRLGVCHGVPRRLGARRLLRVVLRSTARRTHPDRSRTDGGFHAEHRRAGAACIGRHAFLPDGAARRSTAAPPGCRPLRRCGRVRRALW